MQNLGNSQSRYLWIRYRRRCHSGQSSVKKNNKLDDQAEPPRTTTTKQCLWEAAFERTAEEDWLEVPNRRRIWRCSKYAQSDENHQHIKALTRKLGALGKRQPRSRKAEKYPFTSHTLHPSLMTAHGLPPLLRKVGHGAVDYEAFPRLAYFKIDWSQQKGPSPSWTFSAAYMALHGQIIELCICVELDGVMGVMGSVAFK